MASFSVAFFMSARVTLPRLFNRQTECRQPGPSKHKKSCTSTKLYNRLKIFLQSKNPGVSIQEYLIDREAILDRNLRWDLAGENIENRGKKAIS